MQLPEIFQNKWVRLAVAGGVAGGLGVAGWQALHSKNTIPEPILPAQKPLFQLPTPEATALPTATPGVSASPGTEFLVKWGDEMWQCMRMNNPQYPDTFDPEKPAVVVPLDAMRMMGDTTPPFLIIRGTDGPLRVDQIFSWEFHRIANGGVVCVDGK